MHGFIALFTLMMLAVCLSISGVATGQRPPARPVWQAIPADEALNDRQWERVDQAVDRGLRFIASEQLTDGSFQSALGGQPAVTSLGVMAMLSRGHRPGEGPYGEVMQRAIDFVLRCQEPSGLLVLDHRPYESMVWAQRPHTATYNHAISGLMLGEVYGQANTKLNARLKPAIEKALLWARQMQQRPPRYPEDKGGWRYLDKVSPNKPLSDLSVTGWFVMFYRSARNAEFDVPERYVGEAADYVEGCFDPKSGGFFYGPARDDRLVSRGMTGAGVLVLSVAGRRDDEVARRAGQWMLNHPFDQYNVESGGHDRFHYGAYYSSQAMYLLGGSYWGEFYPQLASTLIEAQRADGGWEPEGSNNDGAFGRSYTTALSVLSLTPPYQLLPIYQR